MSMKLAIADPPYLGRAALWYGGKGRSKQGTAGRAAGRGDLAAEYHPDAHEWDDPVKHIALMSHMNAEYDGWAMAASGKTLSPIIGVADKLGARLDRNSLMPRFVRSGHQPSRAASWQPSSASANRPCPWFVAAGRGLTWSRCEVAAKRLLQDALDFGEPA